MTKLEAQQKPTIDAIKSLEQSLNPNRKGVFYKLFEEFTTTTKSQSEIKLTPKQDEGIVDVDEGRQRRMETAEEVRRKKRSDNLRGRRRTIFFLL